MNNINTYILFKEDARLTTCVFETLICHTMMAQEIAMNTLQLQIHN